MYRRYCMDKLTSVITVFLCLGLVLGGMAILRNILHGHASFMEDFVRNLIVFMAAYVLNTYLKRKKENAEGSPAFCCRLRVTSLTEWRRLIIGKRSRYDC